MKPSRIFFGSIPKYVDPIVSTTEEETPVLVATRPGLSAVPYGIAVGTLAVPPGTPPSTGFKIAWAINRSGVL